MADRTPTARTSRKGFPVDPGGGNGDEGGSVRLKNKRITTASELGLAQHLAVLDEATELPPFGFNIAGLEQRLERRLGLEITPVRCGVVFCLLRTAAFPGRAILLWHAVIYFENVMRVCEHTAAAGLYADSQQILVQLL